MSSKSYIGLDVKNKPDIKHIKKKSLVNTIQSNVKEIGSGIHEGINNMVNSLYISASNNTGKLVTSALVGTYLFNEKFWSYYANQNPNYLNMLNDNLSTLEMLTSHPTIQVSLSAGFQASTFAALTFGILKLAETVPQLVRSYQDKQKKKGYNLINVRG